MNIQDPSNMGIMSCMGDEGPQVSLTASLLLSLIPGPAAV